MSNYLYLRLASCVSSPPKDFLKVIFEITSHTEVRASVSVSRSLARRARSLGYSAAFSSSPPASPTFRVSPGGVAILVRSPLSIRKLRPERLEVWEKKAIVFSVLACIPGTVPIYLVGAYGFPPSHEERCNNDAMFVDCLQWAAERRDPVLFLGDLDENLC